MWPHANPLIRAPFSMDCNWGFNLDVITWFNLQTPIFNLQCHVIFPCVTLWVATCVTQICPHRAPEKCQISMRHVLCTATPWWCQSPHGPIGINSILPHGPLEDREKVRLPLVFCWFPLQIIFSLFQWFTLIDIFLPQFHKSDQLKLSISNLWYVWEVSITDMWAHQCTI